MIKKILRIDTNKDRYRTRNGNINDIYQNESTAKDTKLPKLAKQKEPLIFKRLEELFNTCDNQYQPKWLVAGGFVSYLLGRTNAYNDVDCFTYWDGFEEAVLRKFRVTSRRWITPNENEKENFKSITVTLGNNFPFLESKPLNCDNLPFKSSLLPNNESEYTNTMSNFNNNIKLNNLIENDLIPINQKNVNQMILEHLIDNCKNNGLVTRHSTSPKRSWISKFLSAVKSFFINKKMWLYLLSVTDAESNTDSMKDITFKYYQNLRMAHIKQILSFEDIPKLQIIVLKETIETLGNDTTEKFTDIINNFDHVVCKCGFDDTGKIYINRSSTDTEFSTENRYHKYCNRILNKNVVELTTCQIKN